MDNEITENGENSANINKMVFHDIMPSLIGSI